MSKKLFKAVFISQNDDEDVETEYVFFSAKSIKDILKIIENEDDFFIGLELVAPLPGAKFVEI